MNTTQIRNENVILREIIEKNQALFDLLAESKMIDIAFLPLLLGLSEKTVKTRINKIRKDEVGKVLFNFSGSGKSEKIYITNRYYSLTGSKNKAYKFEDLTFEQWYNSRCRAFTYFYNNHDLSDEIKELIKNLIKTHIVDTLKKDELIALNSVDDFIFHKIDIDEKEVLYTVTLAKDFEKYKTLIKKIEELILITEILSNRNFKGCKGKNIKIQLTILSNRPYQLKAFNKAKNKHRRVYTNYSGCHDRWEIFHSGPCETWRFEKYYKYIVGRVRFEIIDSDSHVIVPYNLDRPNKKINKTKKNTAKD